MKRRLALFIGVALLAWLVGLAWQFPSAYAMAWFGPEGVVASGVSGTLWQGRAERIETGAPVAISEVTWELSPWALLRGRWAADARFRIAGLRGEGTLASGPGERVDVDGLVVRGPAADLRAVFPGLGVAPAGQLLLRMDTGTLAGGRIERLAGRLQWSEAALTGPFEIELGRLRASVEPGAGGYAIEITGEGGALDIAGEIDLQPEGAWQADLRLTPTGNAPKGLRETLSFVAKREGDGFRVRRSGRLTLPALH